MTDADHGSPGDHGTPHGPAAEFEGRSPRPAPEAFLETVVALRRFQDGMAAAAPPEDLLREAARTLGELRRGSRRTPSASATGTPAVEPTSRAAARH